MDPATTAVMVSSMCCGIGPAALALAGAIGLGLAAKAFHLRGRGQGYSGGHGGYGRRRRDAFGKSGNLRYMGQVPREISLTDVEESLKRQSTDVPRTQSKASIEEHTGKGLWENSLTEEPKAKDVDHLTNVLKKRSSMSQESSTYNNGYYGKRRKKRSAAEESHAVERTLDLIRQEDITGCGLRLVCELASMDEDQLTVDELSVLDLVSMPMVYPGYGFMPSNGSEDYRIAMSIGLGRGDCYGAYPHCPLNGTEIMEAVFAFLP